MLREDCLSEKLMPVYIKKIRREEDSSRALLLGCHFMTEMIDWRGKKSPCNPIWSGIGALSISRAGFLSPASRRAMEALPIVPCSSTYIVRLIACGTIALCSNPPRAATDRSPLGPGCRYIYNFLKKSFSFFINFCGVRIRETSLA